MENKKKQGKGKGGGQCSGKKGKNKASPTNLSSKKKKKMKFNSDLQLDDLFSGGFGSSWKSSLEPFLESLPETELYIGPNRSSDILPLRELTFQALKPNPPFQWNVIVFGQNPYPRVESATGIAMFDNKIDSWNSNNFGKAASMRCIIKAAAMCKYGVSDSINIAELRSQMQQWATVSPPEWFQSMLIQGVLLLNAALTVGGGLSKSDHNNFWKPIIYKIVEEILTQKVSLPDGDSRKSVVMLWWGRESLKTKKFLRKLLEQYESNLQIVHIEHSNPAAQGDLFCKKPHFDEVNQQLADLGIGQIDWLPDKMWLEMQGDSVYGDFISETQDLHKMYLERLQSGLQQTINLEPIDGIMERSILPLPEACDPIGLRQLAQSTVNQMEGDDSKGPLSVHERSSIFLYTGNSLYYQLNDTLRDEDRSRSVPYFDYLRIFLEAYRKIPFCEGEFYRGIRKDLTNDYEEGSTIIWWSVSSCTPNLSVAQSFGGGSVGGTLFRVRCKTIIPIMELSAYKGEEEYILAPGTQLKVTKVIKKKNAASEIHLEEMDGDRLVK